MMKDPGTRDAGKKPAAKKPAAVKRRHDPAVTEHNRTLRIAKDKALKERAKRKREQRMAHTLNPRRWTAAQVQQTFGNTETRVRGWLADEANIAKRIALVHTYSLIRKPFVARNGRTVSVQQSPTHYCGPDSVEMWHCAYHPMLETYGYTDEDNQPHGPYAHVPLHVVAAYIDWLETLPVPAETQAQEERV